MERTRVSFASASVVERGDAGLEAGEHVGGRESAAGCYAFVEVDPTDCAARRPQALDLRSVHEKRGGLPWLLQKLIPNRGTRQSFFVIKRKQTIVMIKFEINREVVWKLVTFRCDWTSSFCIIF